MRTSRWSSRTGRPRRASSGARRAGIATRTIRHTDYDSREAFDLAVVAELERRHVGLVCLAGFMRLLSPAFIRAFPDAILNIHPSLLPSFAGLDAQRQAWEHGVAVSGATVHIVTPQLDSGPIVRQAVVPVREALQDIRRPTPP